MNHDAGGRPTDPPSPLDCEEALRRLAAWLDAELTPASAQAVETHLKACASCYSRAEFERRLQGIIRQELGQVPLPPGLEHRVRELIRRLPAPTNPPPPGDTPWS